MQVDALLTNSLLKTNAVTPVVPVKNYVKVSKSEHFVQRKTNGTSDGIALHQCNCSSVRGCMRVEWTGYICPGTFPFQKGTSWLITLSTLVVAGRVHWWGCTCWGLQLAGHQHKQLLQQLPLLRLVGPVPALPVVLKALCHQSFPFQLLLPAFRVLDQSALKIIVLSCSKWSLPLFSFLLLVLATKGGGGFMSPGEVEACKVNERDSFFIQTASRSL